MVFSAEDTANPGSGTVNWDGFETSWSINDKGYLVLGEALALQGRTEEAIAAYEEAARINPNETASLVALAQISEAAGHLEVAERRYREALDSNAPSADAALRLAALYYDRGLTSDARATLSNADVRDTAGFDALIRPSAGQVCHSLMVVSNCKPGSAQLQAE